MDKQEYELKQFEQQRVLLQINNDIKLIEEQIANFKSINLKNKVIRNLKISVRFFQRVAPYVLVAGLSFYGFKVLGCGFPFLNSDINQYLRTKKIIDNKGNIIIEGKYRNFLNDSNLMYYYNQWEKIDDEFYKRNILVYELKEIKEDDILALIEKENISLGDVLGEPVFNYIEKRNNISKEELNTLGYLQAIIYDIDRNNYIVTTRTINETIAISLAYVAATILLEFIPFLLRTFSNFDYNYYISEIEKKYPVVDISVLKERIRVKRETYNRLV